MPARPDRDQLESELQKLREPLEKWRMDGQMDRRRIPETNWDRATELAARYVVAAVSVPLRLDHSKLKSKVQARRVYHHNLAARGSPPGSRSQLLKFFELPNGG